MNLLRRSIYLSCMVVSVGSMLVDGADKDSGGSFLYLALYSLSVFFFYFRGKHNRMGRLLQGCADSSYPIGPEVCR
jgi:hypothetical protein